MTQNVSQEVGDHVAQTVKEEVGDHVTASFSNSLPPPTPPPWNILARRSLSVQLQDKLPPFGSTGKVVISSF